MSIFFDLIIILISFTAFALLHSWMASRGLKEKLKAEAGNLMAFYRLAYNLIAFFSLYLMYEILPHPDVQLYDLPKPYDMIILIPQFLALAGILWTFRYICLKEFLGLSQVVRYFEKAYSPDELDEHLTLRIAGPYRYSRHPLYFFTIGYFLFRPEMDLFYLVFILFLIVYFYIGSVYEEKRLINTFGEVYSDYRKKVPRIIPTFIQRYRSSNSL